jgi:hypothetical protein
MTAGQIGQSACARLDEADPANPISVTNAEVLNAVNEGYLLSSLLTLFLVKTASFPLASCWHQIRPALPDFLVPLRLSVNGVRIRPSTLTDLDGWNSAWQATAGPPSRYVTQGSNLLAITPQIGVALASMTYAYSPVRLAAGDTPLLPAQYHPALVEHATYRLLGTWVRQRSEAAHYDVMPIEMKLLDRSKLIDRILARQAKQAAKVGAK